MKNKIHKTIAVIILTISLFSFSVPMNEINFSNAEESVKVKAPQFLTVKRKSSKSLLLRWDKVVGVDGYIIYKRNKKKKYVKVKTNKGESSNKVLFERLKKKTIYRYKVKSFIKDGGKKTLSVFTYSVFAKTTLKKDKKQNVDAVKSESSARYLGLKAVKKLAVNTSVKGKNKKAINKALRLRSSNVSLLKITKGGDIRTQGQKGECFVYAIAHNGVRKDIKIIIDDFANPGYFENLDKISDENVKSVLSNNKDELCYIANVLQNETKFCEFEYADGYLQLNREFSKEFEDKALSLLKATKVYYIKVEDGFVTFLIEGKINPEAIYFSDYNTTEAQAAARHLVRLATGWVYQPGD